MFIQSIIHHLHIQANNCTIHSTIQTFIHPKTTTTQQFKHLFIQRQQLLSHHPNITCLTILSNTSSTHSILKWHQVIIQVLQPIDSRIKKLNALQFTVGVVCRHVLRFLLHHRIVMQCFGHASSINASFGNGLQPKLSYTLVIMTR